MSDLTEQSLSDMLAQLQKVQTPFAKPDQMVVHPMWIGTPELEAYLDGRLFSWVWNKP